MEGFIHFKTIGIIYFMMLGILSLLEAFQIQKKLKKYIYIITNILFMFSIFISSIGADSWKDIVKNWHFLLLTLSLLLIAPLLSFIFKGQAVIVYSNDENYIVETIKQILIENNHEYDYEENFGRIIFKIDKFNKITLNPATKFFKDEVKYYTVGYSSLHNKELKNIGNEIENKLNTPENKEKGRKTKTSFYMNIIFAAISFYFSILMIIKY